MTLPRNTNEPWVRLRAIFCREIGREAGRPIGLALAIFLDLLVGVVAVQFDDPLAAADLGDQIVGLRRPPGQQVDDVLGRLVAGFVGEARLFRLVVGRVGERHDGLDRLPLACERNLLAGARGA